jgi:hypothetical protein
MRKPHCLVVAAALIAAGPANAEVVGITKSAQQTVTGNVSGVPRVVVTASEIYENERLRANASGNAQIELRDGTKIVVGPNADVVVDDFVFAKNNKAAELTIRATKGAFRFITGSSDHSAYKIVTPYASIGVRGTAFDVTLANGGANIALLQGQITVCDRKGACKRVDRSCTYTFVGNNGVADPKAMISPSRATRQGDLFPILAKQGDLRSEFRKFALSCETAQLDLRELAPPEQQITVSPETVGSIDNPPDVQNDGVPNNPGNDKEVGNAGNNPNGQAGFSGENGRSGNNGNGNGNGNGNNG